MKRVPIKTLLRICALTAGMGLAIGFAAGCKTNTANPPVLAPGYQNSADQEMGKVLAGARKFYLSIQDQVNAKTLTLGDSIKASFNAFGVTLNAADSVYLAYHNGTATQAQAQAAVDKVQSEQAALPLPGAK